MQAPSSPGAIVYSKQLSRLEASFFRAQTPDPILTVSEWSDRFRVLSSIASAEPGPWRTSRTPYLRELMDCLSASSPIQEVVFMKGSQIGGSESGLNWVGYVIDQAPGPMMVVQPTAPMAKKFGRQRVDSMLRVTPRLQEKVSQKKSRDSSNTQVLKEFDGGILALSGANSAVELRSMPIRYLMLDEIDGYPRDLDGEGDPVSLAEKRTATYGRRKVLKVSTPTIKNASRIEDAYNASDKRRYLVPCPLCDHFQQITWDHIRWDRGNPDSAHMRCESCKGKIQEHHKTVMLDRGRWEKKNPKSRIAGFHLSSLYSPLGWYSWGQAAHDFLFAQNDPSLLRVFVNTVLGETWQEKGEAPEWDRLYERRESYPLNVVPVGVIFITAGIDVQKDRFEIEIVGWGRDKQSWSIDYRVVEADTSDVRNFTVLDQLLSESWVVKDTPVKLPLSRIAIDSGSFTQTVYQAVRKRRTDRLIATKGFEKHQTIIGIPSTVDLNYRGKRIKMGARVWPIGVNIAKSELYSWLRLAKPTQPSDPFPPGYCHIPEYPEEYFKMLTAEQMIKQTLRGYVKYVWEKIRDRNEALDCRVMARAAAQVVGLDRFTERDWNELEKALRSKESIRKGTEPAKTRGGIPIKESKFWGGGD